MRHVLVPASYVLLVLFVGTMLIPQGYAQPSPGDSHEPSQQAPSIPYQAQQQPPDHGILGTDRVVATGNERTTTPGGNQVRSLLQLSEGSR